MGPRIRLFHFIVLVSLSTSKAFGAGLPLDPTQFADPNSLLSDDIVKPVITTIGLLADHRPYEPASPQTGLAGGWDFSIEATLIKLSDDFKGALETAGLSGSGAPPSAPVPRINVHKGFGPRLQVGASLLFYAGNYMAGGDVKAVLYHPEEGLTWAARLNYSQSRLLIVETRTITPQILVSRKVGFGDPYLGFGVNFIRGKVAVPIDQLIQADLPDELKAQIATNDVLSKEASNQHFMAFIGVGMDFGPAPLRLTLEGAYSQLGGHYFGLKFGVRL